jgi:agmatinase
MEDDAGDRPLTAMRLSASDELALESRDETHVVVVNTAFATRMKLSLSAYRFLKAFSSPRRIDQVVPDRAMRRILPQVRMLVDKRMLVDADSPAAAETSRLRAAVAYKFCGAPAHSSSTDSDFVVLGIPWDLAGESDCRQAPASIRRKSLDYSYQLDFDDGRPRGWFDVNRGVRMLRGATIADAGDVPIEYGESRARYFERVRGALAQSCTGPAIPLILGGDRSVTCAALGSLAHEGRLGMVQLTADPGRAAAEGAGSSLSRLDKVEAVTTLDGDALRALGPDGIARSWIDGLPVYLSIDLSIVTEGCMNAARLGRPDGPTVHELKTAIAALGRAHRIVGIDLVGLDRRSDSAELAAVTGCHLALAAMSAAYDRL